MLPGPVLIKQCPQCQKLFSESTLASGNTIGATFWTDGKCEAPMLPETPWLVKCPHCGHLIWIDEAWQVGKKDPFGQSSRWPDALLTYEELNELEHLAALDTQLADTPKKIRYIRMRAWWQANDRFRETIPDRAADLSVQARSNMEALSNMLSESDENQRLMKAELARELGRFEEAERLLAFGYSNRVSTYVQRISELVKIRDARVAKL